MSNRIRSLLLPLLFSSIVAASLGADAPTNASRQENSSSDTNSKTSSSAPANLATDPSYRLIAGDTVHITVSTESNQVETSAAQTIGHSGDIRLPWIKELIKLGGKSVREAEHYLETLYRDKKLLNAPVVSVKVSAYFPREVSILGAVRSPGSLTFPPDTTTLDIATVIAKVGGFTPAAKKDAVTVTHRGEDEKETTQTVDLSDIYSSRRKAGRDRADILIYPGDRIFVPESLF